MSLAVLIYQLWIRSQGLYMPGLVLPVPRHFFREFFKYQCDTASLNQCSKCLSRDFDYTEEAQDVHNKSLLCFAVTSCILFLFWILHPMMRWSGETITPQVSVLSRVPQLAVHNLRSPVARGRVSTGELLGTALRVIWCRGPHRCTGPQRGRAQRPSMPRPRPRLCQVHESALRAKNRRQVAKREFVAQR